MSDALASGSSTAPCYTTAGGTTCRGRQDRPACHLRASHEFRGQLRPWPPTAALMCPLFHGGLNGPLWWSTLLRHDRRGLQESAAGQRFL